MTERGFFEAEAKRRRSEPVAEAGPTPRADHESEARLPAPVRAAGHSSHSSHRSGTPRPTAQRQRLGGWSRRRGLVLLWWLAQAAAAVIVGVLLFDRVLMPAVVRHGSEVSVPDMRGLPVENARESIDALGLQAVVSQGRFDPNAPAGTIVETSPEPGVAVKEGRQVFLTPSLGKENRVVPDLHGMSVRLAMMKLGEVGLRVGATDHAASDAFPAGQVMATNPPSGAPVPAAGDVSLLVSRKKAPIPLWMPDLAGRSANETAAWLGSCGFQVRIEETSLPGNVGAVLEQDPLPGAPVWPGAMVRLTAVRDRDQLERDRDRPGRGWRR